ncbi:PLC-like phosphodiesterase [Aaosphaeria arxii CBS 175.79]|uniref:PLC-like phosphodiesterase n=1 Tax=Aaosphaeria arxii CBS 175.79 TaxID=1450172 RepID=A0A6A5XLT5_9PLEO|nr:PLC-like phosphodiesterase [Aaosphaeria arxii CBS 175.79]KAF2013829.1 PLC-like phosphodiesterase [Aaosphaeria arxii CBS 175.79]
MKTTTTLLLQGLWLAGFAMAQDSSSSQEVRTLSGSDRRLTSEVSQVTLPSDFEGSSFATGTMSMSGVSVSTGAPNTTASMSSTSKTNTLTQLVGGTPTTLNGTASSTSAAPQPSNTQPCNNYPEFCTRKYSNITEVCAHNSPFAVKRNVGSNQAYGVTAQLNDGIRMLQGQTHDVNGTLHYCHTSCDLLDAGTVEDYFRDVTNWLQSNPFEVVTILVGNYDYEKKDDNGNPLVTSKNYVDPIEKSGLMPYIYQPPKTAMEVDDWPTLGELIISGKRVIMFIDYNYDTDAVPFMLWEFYNMWETPFSPTDINFPCTIDRPDGISDEKAKKMLYMANHNLNVEVSIGSLSLLIPNTVQLNVTNGLNGTGSLGLQSNRCTDDWGRPPNFLLVDYYNEGSFNGSVFEVAARANNVTYDRECCGTKSLAAPILSGPSAPFLGLVVAVAFSLFL